ncbi:hypothetical protein [Amphritea japonica]|uniref:hypothetical protein n=1 Tax=Amphritea japonica TaxID=452627 RepID=UPI000372525D|nr:hypothetical protein [Amphritea japonica]
MEKLEKTPKLIWVLASITIFISAIGMLFLALYIEIGAVPHPWIFGINATLSIVLSVGIILRNALAVYLYALLKVSMIIPLIVASEWFIGIPFTYSKLASSALLPILLLASSFYYISGFTSWPISNKRLQDELRKKRADT